MSLIRFIFKKKIVFQKSYIFIEGFIPKKFKRLLHNINSFNPSCKILYFSKKENLEEIDNIIRNYPSTIMIAKYSKNKNKSRLIIKKNLRNMSISLEILEFTLYFSKVFFGNADKWSRPIFMFEPIFDQRPELKTFKLLISSFFNSKTKDHKIHPYFDHILAFFYINTKIIFRVYQISKKKKEKINEKSKNLNQLIEIGPRLKFKIEKFQIG